MTKPFDALETRDPATREREDFAQLRALLGAAMPHAPALAKQLEGVDIGSLTSRAALSALPVLRKSDLLAMQQENLPFAGLVPKKTGRAEAPPHVPRPDF